MSSTFKRCLVQTENTRRRYKRSKQCSVNHPVLTGNASRLFCLLLVLYNKKSELYCKHLPTIYKHILSYISSFNKTDVPETGCLMKINYHDEMVCYTINASVHLGHSQPYVVLLGQTNNYILQPQSNICFTFDGGRYQGLWLCSKKNELVSARFNPFVPHTKNMRIRYYNIQSTALKLMKTKYPTIVEERKINFPAASAFRCAICKNFMSWTQLDSKHNRLEIALYTVDNTANNYGLKYNILQTRIAKKTEPINFGHLTTRNQPQVRLQFHSNGNYLLLVCFTYFCVWKLKPFSDEKAKLLLCYNLSSDVSIQACFHPIHPVLYVAKRTRSLLLQRINLSNPDNLKIGLEDVMCVHANTFAASRMEGLECESYNLDLAVSPTLVMVSSCFSQNDVVILNPSKKIIVRRQENVLERTKHKKHQVLQTFTHSEEDVFFVQCTENQKKKRNFTNTFYMHKI